MDCVSFVLFSFFKKGEFSAGSAGYGSHIVLAAARVNAEVWVWSLSLNFCMLQTCPLSPRKRRPHLVLAQNLIITSRVLLLIFPFSGNAKIIILNSKLYSKVCNQNSVSRSILPHGWTLGLSTVFWSTLFCNYCT